VELDLQIVAELMLKSGRRTDLSWQEMGEVAYVRIGRILSLASQRHRLIKLESFVKGRANETMPLKTHIIYFATSTILLVRRCSGR